MATHRRKSITRQRILAAALDLFATHGFEGTSVQEIADRASVAHGTVFWHFHDKAQLYAYAMQIAGDRFLRSMHGIAHADSGPLAAALAEWVRALEHDHRVLVSIAGLTYRDPAHALVVERLNERLVGFWQRRLEGERELRETDATRRRELAQLIVTTSFTVALLVKLPSVCVSTLVTDFATTLLRMGQRQDRFDDLHGRAI
ncbi:MAG: TetR/AcrR family transcriptional regulator [Gammaproteobacteria bacterium]|nr:TetR/AcrR family transcriptional regulator [Gammaproteobacteria bacterium]